MSNPWLYPGSPVQNIHWDFVQDYIENLEIIDAITDEISSIKFTLADSATKQFYQRYQAKDIIELWINDGFNGADFGNEAHRVFCGRIDKIIPRLSGGAWKVDFEARDYLADLMEMEAFICYYDGTPDAILVDLVAQLNTQRGSLSNSNIINAQPRFELAYDSLDSSNHQDEYFINSQSYFDAIASLATSYGKTLKMSYANFHPLLYWDAGIGNKVTINVKNPQTVGDLSFGITQGQNMQDGSTSKNVQGTKTKIRLYSVDGNGTPIYVEKEATTAGTGRTLQLGTDRYGEINNWTDVSETAKAWGLVDALGTALIAKLSQARREYQFNIFPGRIDLAKKMAGNKILVLAPSLDIGSPGESLEVIQAKHRWSSKGLETNFNLANYNPAFHRLLCPPTKATLGKAAGEVYVGFRIYYLERGHFGYGPSHEIGVYSYNPHDPSSRRFEFWLPNTGIFYVEGVISGELSAVSITHPDLAQTFRWVVEKSGATLYRISLYNEGDFGSPSGYLVAQSVYQATNQTFTLIAQGGWGVSGTVFFNGVTQRLNANQRIHYGFDIDNPANAAWMGYHRGSLFVMLQHSLATGTGPVIKKYSLTGSLIDTWNIGPVTEGSPTPIQRVVYDAAIIAESDSPAFVFMVPLGYVRTANWKGTLSAPYRTDGPGPDESSYVYANAVNGGMAYIQNDEYLVYSNNAKTGGGSTYLQWFFDKFCSKVMSDTLTFPLREMLALEPETAGFQPMARTGKLIYTNSTASAQGWFDSAGLKFDFNGGLWYMRSKENNVAINSNRLTRWGLDVQAPINYLDFASYTPINGVPRGICIVPIRKEKQL